MFSFFLNFIHVGGGMVSINARLMALMSIITVLILCYWHLLCIMSNASLSFSFFLFFQFSQRRFLVIFLLEGVWLLFVSIGCMILSSSESLLWTSDNCYSFLYKQVPSWEETQVFSCLLIQCMGDRVENIELVKSIKLDLTYFMLNCAAGNEASMWREKVNLILDLVNISNPLYLFF